VSSSTRIASASPSPITRIYRPGDAVAGDGGAGGAGGRLRATAAPGARLSALGGRIRTNTSLLD
jgi:hypothetical protein